VSDALHFYYDVVCPYAYLASLQIDGFAAGHGLCVERHPVLLGGLLRAFGAADDPNRQMSAPRARHTHGDIRRHGVLYGRPLQVPPGHPRRTVAAMRLVTGAPAALRTDVARALFEAYWEQGRDVADPSVVADVAGRFAIDPGVVDDPAVKAELRASTDAAAARGVFGVPTFVHGNDLVWGQDRLGVLAAALGRPSEDPAAPILGAAAVGERVAPATVEIFHDFSSPFSYLASTQIERVAGLYGARVEWVPILLGALFRDIGTADVPLFTMHATKQAWVRRDLDDWAALWKVPLRFPTEFPIRTVLPLRAALVEPRATPAIYRAAWVDDRPIGTPEVLADVLGRAGFDARDVLGRCDLPETKARLRDNTARAAEIGVCGVPTYVVARERGPLVLWGQDRLAMLATALAGVELPD
jgi:2-hydroxychromene-2-carboxylate isomerase